MILARTVVELSHKQIVDTDRQTQTDAGNEGKKG